MKHEHADVIHAWADGETIQYKDKTLLPPLSSVDTWHDWLSDKLRNPFFVDDRFKWRIKPEPWKYRVALMEADDGTCFMQLENSPSYLDLGAKRVFVKYLTDWVEVEV